jgi:hypothetical protein
MKILLDYFFPVVAVEPTQAVNTGFLKNVLVVANPKAAVPPDVIQLVTSAAGAAAITDNQDVVQLFNAGMTRVYILPTTSLDIADALETSEGDFFTILISSDFTDLGMADLDVGTFNGVVGVSSTDDAFLEAQAIIPNRAAFHTTTATKAKNMFYAFGKLLSNQLGWKNQQYIVLPFADDVDTTGEAENLFELRINFAISDSEYGQRLGFFVAGGKAITAPYILANLQLDLKSEAMQYVSSNMPDYTKSEAALIEDELKKVIESYKERKWIESGEVAVKLEQENFVASAYIIVPDPKALWRIYAEMRTVQ